MSRLSFLRILLNLVTRYDIFWMYTIVRVRLNRIEIINVYLFTKGYQINHSVTQKHEKVLIIEHRLHY
jgi:hypothetical protein